MVFAPVRRRVQTGVDRRFNRTRYDAESELVALSTDLAAAAEIPEIRADIGGVLSRTVEPATATWWVPGDDARGASP
jgi:hypothetical protein